MRVAFVAPRAVLGGAERHLVGLTSGLVEAGVDARCVLAEPGPLTGLLDAAGVPWTSASPQDLADEIEQSDLVVGWSDHGHLLAGPIAIDLQRPAIWWRTLTWRDRPYEREAAAVPARRVVVATNRSGEAQARATPHVPVAVIAPGLPIASIAARRSEGKRLRRALGWDDCVIIGMVARLDPIKGQDALLRAARDLLTVDERCRILIVGSDVVGFDRDLAAELILLATSLGIADRVRFVDHLVDPIPAQAALDIAVNASQHEAFGISTLEAMALGTPVVATATDGSRELLREGRDGVLVPVDDPAALAAALLALADDLDRRHEVGAAGRSRAADFDEVLTVKATIALFEAVLGAPVGRTVDAVADERSAGPERGEGSLTVEAVTSIDDVIDLWDALAAAADQPFAHRDWLLPHADGTPPTAALVRRGGEAIGLYLLVRRAGRVEFLGSPLSDRLGPIGHPDDGATLTSVLPAVVELLVDGDECFAGESLPSDWAAELPASWLGPSEACPVIEIGDVSWEDYLRLPGSARRRRIADQAARLLSETDAEVRVHEDAVGIVEALDTLVHLHDARFGTASRTFSAARRPIFEAALPALAERGQARIATLLVDDRPAAAILVFTGGGDDWYYQAGFDPTFAERSVGRALFADTVRDSFARRRGAFHLLRGDEPYKGYWATRIDHVTTVVRP